MSDDYLSQPLNISSNGECKLSQIWNWTSLNIRFEFLFVEKSSSAPSSSSSSSLFSSPSRQQSVNAFSPYLNYDPRLLQQSQPEFIFPEGASKQRGRFELAFSQIGSAVMVWSTYCATQIEWVLIFLHFQIGASLGGVAGLYNGVVATNLAKQTGKLRRTQ